MGGADGRRQRTLIPPSCACARAAGGAAPDILRLFRMMPLELVGGEEYVERMRFPLNTQL